MMRLIFLSLLWCLLAIAPAGAAVTCSNLTNGANIGGPGTTQATASVSVVSGQIVVVTSMDFWSNGDAGITTPTLSGDGTTFTVAVHNSGTVNTTSNAWPSITIFTGIPPSSTSGALTIDWTNGPFGQPGSVIWSVDTCTGASGSIPQTASTNSGGTTTTSQSMTLGALGSGSASFGAFSWQGSGSLTIGSGYTSLANNNQFSIWAGLTEYKSAGSTTVNATGGTGDWASASIEIAAPAAGGAVPKGSLQQLLGVGR